MCIISINLQNKSIIKDCLWHHFYSWENWILEKVNYLPKIPKLIRQCRWDLNLSLLDSKPWSLSTQLSPNHLYKLVFFKKFQLIFFFHKRISKVLQAKHRFYWSIQYCWCNSHCRTGHIISEAQYNIKMKILLLKNCWGFQDSDSRALKQVWLPAQCAYPWS